MNQFESSFPETLVQLFAFCIPYCLIDLLTVVVVAIGFHAKNLIFQFIKIAQRQSESETDRNREKECECLNFILHVFCFCIFFNYFFYFTFSLLLTLSLFMCCSCNHFILLFTIYFFLFIMSLVMCYTQGTIFRTFIGIMSLFFGSSLSLKNSKDDKAKRYFLTAVFNPTLISNPFKWDRELYIHYL